jgi:hypothetical protein
MDRDGDADDDEDAGAVPTNVMASSFVEEFAVTGPVTLVAVWSR